MSGTSAHYWVGGVVGRTRLPCSQPAKYGIYDTYLIAPTIHSAHPLSCHQVSCNQWYSHKFGLGSSHFGTGWSIFSRFVRTPLQIPFFQFQFSKFPISKGGRRGRRIHPPSVAVPLQAAFKLLETPMASHHCKNTRIATILNDRYEKWSRRESPALVRSQ